MLTDDLRRHAGKFYGKYGGQVTANDDAQHCGRIYVRVPAVFANGAPVRALPCLPPGHFFVPPVGTSVWVEFQGGDTRYPLWVGVYYQKDATPQPAAIDPPENRVIHTPSGHTIEILDKEGQEKIVIKHKANAFVSMDEHGSVVISNPNGSHLHLDANGHVATFVGEDGHMLTMGKDGAVLVSKDGALLELTGKTARLLGKDVIVQGTTVALGVGAQEPTLLGTTFAQMWNLFIAHTHPSAVGPTGTPVPPPQPLAPGSGLTSAVLVK